MTVFRKLVSKGSRFNQIYIPKGMEGLIEVGDEVEVRLLKKHTELHHSKGLRLSPFKENLVKGIFQEIDSADYLFIVGSFLTEKIDYHDIDVVAVARGKGHEEQMYNTLMEKFDLRFHILSLEPDRLMHLFRICPLTRAMFSTFVCNKQITFPEEKEVDVPHIRFLLMMPYDLLEIRLGSRLFFDGMRRLVTVGRFLENKSLGIAEINDEVKEGVGERLYAKIRQNEEIEENSIGLLRRIMRSRLKKIEGLISHGQK